MHARLILYQPVLSQYRGGGPWVRGKRGCSLAVGRRGAYFRVPTQALLGEMSYWDDISPKSSKYKLESLGACYRGW